MGKKTESKKEEGKKIELSRLNKGQVIIENGLLNYKRVSVRYVPFSEEVKKQIGKVIYDAYKSLTEPVKITKLPVNLVSEVRKIIGTSDYMAVGAFLLHEIPNIEHYMGLWYHNLYIGKPEHFKTTESQTASLSTVDITDFSGLPKV